MILRGSNVILRGNGDLTYFQAYKGSKDLSEPIPADSIAGTLAFSPASLTVTGTGTAFLDDLHLGQMLLANEEVLVVRRLVSQTSFITDRLPITTETIASAERLPVIFALDTKRGAMRRGNAIKFDKGTIIAVGDGALYVNGTVLAGESLVATRRAQVALYDSATMSYSVEDVGFDTVPTVTNADISIVGSGGTKNTSLGYYSFMLAYYSDITSGSSNPTDVLLSGGTAGYQITIANSTFEIDKSSDTPPDKATGYIIYATAFGGTSAISQLNAIQGPWYELKRVPFTDFTANLYAFDYVDADLSTTFATQSNDSPPDAEYVASLAGFVNLISADGPGVNSTGREASTSPGPVIAPMSAYNFDAFPATTYVPTEQGETIVGCVSAAGRLFPMTPNTLQASTPTGLPTAPFTLRPFWKRGFVNPYNLIFVDDTLYGFSGNKIFRSIATGDAAQEGYEFASPVEAQLASFSAGYVFLAHDPVNELVCLIASAVRQDNGYWVSEIYPYSLTKFQWMPVVTLASATRDMIVSGAATVDGVMYFIAGGRRAGDTTQCDTFQFDADDGATTDWYVAWAYSDMGIELHPKKITRIRPKGKFAATEVMVFGVTADTDIDVDDLETGTNPVLTLTLAASSAVKQYEASKVRATNLLMGTIRVSGESDGTDPDELHEVVLDVAVVGGVK